MNRIIKRISGWKKGFTIKKDVGKERMETTFRELWIDISGKKIYAHIHSPAKPGKYPGVVIIPGGKSPGTDYDKGFGLKASEVASFGFVVLHYDPSGRGKTGGIEDHWGTAHQEELSKLLFWFADSGLADKDNIGILSFSIGIVISTGALARFPTPDIKYLFDWEGPSNRFNTTKNDTHEPIKDFPLSNLEFWCERQAANFIGNIVCGYFRYQADDDHVQGKYKGHAIELVNKAAEGKAAWTRCNDFPEGMTFDPETPDKYEWLPKHLNNSAQMIKYLLQIKDR